MHITENKRFATLLYGAIVNWQDPWWVEYTQLDFSFLKETTIYGNLKASAVGNPIT